MDIFVIASLNEIALHMPQYADSARGLLRRAAISGGDPLDRWNTLKNLERSGDPTTPDILAFVAVNDTDWGNRLNAVFDLIHLNYSNSKSVLYERLQNDPYPSNREIFAGTLAGLDNHIYGYNKFGSPQDFKQIMDQILRETDSTTKYWMTGFLEEAAWTSPDSTLTVVNLIDTLIVMREQVATFNWLGDQNFISVLDSNMASAHAFITQGDSNNCARQVRLFQQQVRCVQRQHTSE